MEDDDDDDFFGGFRRLQTMPVRSVLPDKDLNFDEIESCKISGMESSNKESVRSKEDMLKDIEEALAEDRQQREKAL